MRDAITWTRGIGITLTDNWELHVEHARHARTEWQR